MAEIKIETKVENKIEKKAERDLYLDMLRAVAALAIVVIHTAFHSGGQYVKPWFQSLTLLIDVPLFFFISGYTQFFHFGDLSKTFRGLAKLWVKYVFFLFVLMLIHVISSPPPLI